MSTKLRAVAIRAGIMLFALLAGWGSAWIAPSYAQVAVDPRSMISLHSEGQAGPPARIADLAWLEGSWIGEMPDGPVEHVILGPKSGHLPGFVRALNSGGVSFYEITLFAQIEGSLAYRVKHFTPALAGWEAQDAFVDRPLVERRGESWRFDGITFARTGPDSFTVYFLPRTAEGEGDTLVIPFRRMTPYSDSMSK